MYRQEELLQYVECTENELEKIIRELEIEKQLYSKEDLELIKGRVEHKKAKMNQIALLLVAIAGVAVLMLFVMSLIAANTITG